MDTQGGRGSRQRGGGGSAGGGRRGGGTRLYDAVYLASDELKSQAQGRKALIILSDGVDHGSKERLAQAIETAQRADTVVYSILFSDEEASSHYGGLIDGSVRGTRRKISAAPAGASRRKVSKKEPIDKIYGGIEEELGNQYGLGYTPEKELEPGYHKIHLSTHN